MWWKLPSELISAALATGLVARLLGRYLSRRYAKRYPTNKSYERLKPERGTDTVIFVHGLHGHFRNTWPQLPELLHGDPDLPQLDVILWGYRASIFPGVLRLPAVGRALMSFVRDMCPAHSHLFFVGHSMGGLVILDGLAQEAFDGRATERPVGATRHVVLYATPINGSAVASAIRSTVGYLHRIGHFVMSGHLQELQRGGYCDELARKVVNRLYNPNIAPGDINSKARVPIKAIAGELDVAVQTSSATFFLEDPPPSFFPADDHFTVKEAADRGDPRYRALQVPLARYYEQWFRDKSRAALAGDAVARIELLARCGHAAATRLRGHLAPDGAADTPKRVQGLLAAAMTLASGTTVLDFAAALNLALAQMVQEGK